MQTIFFNFVTLIYPDGTKKEKLLRQTHTLPHIWNFEFDISNDVKETEAVEFVLNKTPISAGSEGFYIVPAGNRMCPSRDYGLGLFEQQENQTISFPDAFMPVYGFKLDSTVYTVIVTGMCHDAEFVVDITDNQYTFKLRFETIGHNFYEPIRFEIHTLDNPNATWCDIAKEYRSHQLQSGFKPLKDRLNPDLKYSLEAPNVRIRMAWKPVPCTIYEQTPENEPPVHVACTFQDIIRLMEAYQKVGVEKAEFCLVGWNIKGHDGRWPQILPVESEIGGEEGLRILLEKAKEFGYAVTCHTNSTDGYSIAENFDESDVALLPDGSKSIEAERWSGGRSYNLCPKRAYEISMQTLPEVAKLGFRGMHYIDVITCTPARECYNPKHPLNKQQACDYLNNLLMDTAELFGSIGSEGPYDHSLKNCDYTLYASFSDFYTASKLHKLAKQPIPFWQVVYHGIVASNPYARTVNAINSSIPDDFLKVIEYGGKPQVYYYAQFVTDGSDWIGKGDFHCNTEEEIMSSAKKVKEWTDVYNELSYLQYEYIENHEEIDTKVFKTTYSDGSETIVDYNTNTYTLKKGTQI